MHEAIFSNAVQPKSVSVLRLNLLPYSLGHEVLLYRVESPFVYLSDASFDALPLADRIKAVRIAALICSNTWKQNQRPQRWLSFWTWFTRRSDFEQEILTVREYLKEGNASLPTPDSKGPGDNFPCADAVCNGRKEESGRLLGSPLIAQLYNFMVGKVNGEIWDTPKAFASMLYFTHLETEGHLRIENLNEYQEREHIWQQWREWKAEQPKEQEKQQSSILASEVPDELK